MNRTMINPFSQDAHGHPLSEAYQNAEYLCHGCHTLGFGTSKRCKICNFDLHDYCATCPNEIRSPNIHPGHSMRLVFERANTPAPTASWRVCDVCGDEVDGLYYHCEDCDLDVHPLCHQLPLRIRHPALHLHDLIFGRHQDNGATCKVCGEPCKFWWYRSVENSCAAARVNVHPECLVKPYDEEADRERSVRPRPTQQQQQQQSPGYPRPPPAAPHNRLYDDYQTFLLNQHHQQQQHYHPAPPHHHYHQQQQHHVYPHHNPHLHRVHSCPSAYVSPHNPAPYQLPHSHPPHVNQYHHSPAPTPHMHTQYGHRPAANALGYTYSSPSQGYGYPGGGQQTETSPDTYPSHDGGDEKPNGKKRRRIYAVVGNLLASVLTIGIFSIPNFFG